MSTMAEKIHAALATADTYTVVKGKGCSGNTPWAVVDQNGEREGCFEDPDDAKAFIRDLVANGDDEAKEKAENMGIAPDAPVIDADAQRFTAVLTVEGVQTGDRRFIEPGALDWRDLPLTLMLQKSTPAGGMGGNPHAGAVAAGRIDTIERLEQPDGTVQIIGTGVFDAGADGQEAFRMVGDGTIRGVSVDLTNVVAQPECLAEDDEGNCLDGRDVFTQGRIMGATITPFQAIEPATIALAASISAPGADMWITSTPGGRYHRGEYQTRSESLAATAERQKPTDPIITASSVAPLVPPAEWFQRPEVDRPVAHTVTPEGRVFGYLAQWGQCHLGFVNQAFKKCVTVPASKTGYALFAKPGGQLAKCCTDCDSPPTEVTVGSLVFGTTHADLSMPWKYAAEFYENTGKVAAHVAIGEDEFGIWYSGALNPALSQDDVWTLRGAKVSGDWRRYGGGLELTSILCVNTPGFPVGAPKVGFADGEPTALVASLAPEGDLAVGDGPSWSDFNLLRNELESLRAVVRPAAPVLRQLADEAADGIVAELIDVSLADITAIGRAKNPDAVKAHIRKRAAALDLTAWLKEHAPSVVS